MRRLGGIAVSLFSLLLIACSQPSEKSERKQTEKTAEVDPTKAAKNTTAAAYLSDPHTCLMLDPTKTHGVRDEYSMTISGIVTNACLVDFSYIQIVFKITDRQGNVTGNAIANQLNLRSMENWRFKAVTFSEGSRFTLDEITAY